MIRPTFILAFGSKARQGKDSAANHIHVSCPRNTRIYSFAAALKAFCRVQHGMTIKDPDLLQRVGAEMRQKDPDIWIKVLDAQLNEECPSVALIPDCRYQNEAEWVKARGGKVVRVFRPGFVADDRDATHPSETDLDLWPFDFTIINTSLSALERQALDYFNAVWHPSMTAQAR